MKLPEHYRYSKEHEWVQLKGDIATIGITDYAQEQLGDVVFVELPEVGHVFHINKSLATVESVKAVSEVYAPVGGQVIEANSSLSSSPELVNNDPYGAAWFVRIKLTNIQDFDQLLSANEYQSYVAEESD